MSEDRRRYAQSLSALPIGDVAAGVDAGASPLPSPRRFSLLDALLLDGFEHRNDPRTVEQVCSDVDAREVRELLGEDELAY